VALQERCAAGHYWKIGGSNVAAALAQIDSPFSVAHPVSLNLSSEPSGSGIISNLLAAAEGISC